MMLHHARNIPYLRGCWKLWRAGLPQESLYDMRNISYLEDSKKTGAPCWKSHTKDHIGVRFRAPFLQKLPLKRDAKCNLPQQLLWLGFLLHGSLLGAPGASNVSSWVHGNSIARALSLSLPLSLSLSLSLSLDLDIHIRIIHIHIHIYIYVLIYTYMYAHS